MIVAAPNPGSLDRVEAARSRDGYCPSCGEALIAKCGPLVAWHWAHRARDCDPWYEPESDWHLRWKRYLRARGALIEAPIGPHRADAVLRDGRIVELQASYLPATAIREREDFYGPRLVWLYDGSLWEERLHYGPRGFWIKNGPRSLTVHRARVTWHLPRRGVIVAARASLVGRNPRRVVGVFDGPLRAAPELSSEGVAGLAS